MLGPNFSLIELNIRRGSLKLARTWRWRGFRIAFFPSVTRTSSNSTSSWSTSQVYTLYRVVSSRDWHRTRSLKGWPWLGRVSVEKTIAKHSTFNLSSTMGSEAIILFNKMKNETICVKIARMQWNLSALKRQPTNRPFKVWNLPIYLERSTCRPSFVVLLKAYLQKQI